MQTHESPGLAAAVIDRIGGLLEIGAMGAGDYRMVLGMVGSHEFFVPVGASKGYENSIASFKRNTYGVLEFSGGKPNLKRAPVTGAPPPDEAPF